MALQKEIWVQDIQEKLFSKNEFIDKVISHDAFVDNKTVHLPQSGTLPAVQKDRSVLPATISERTDTDETYNLSEYTTDPILVRDLDELQNSYEKRQSVLQHHINKLNDRLGLEFLYQGAANSSTEIVQTTGTATANIAPTGATGNRNALKIIDLASAAKKLDKDNVSQDNRYIVMPSDMYWNFLIEEPTILSKEYNPVRDADLAMGVVKNVLGWKIIVRSHTVVFNNTPAKKAIGAASATTDNWGAVGFHGEYIARALGDVKVFADEDKPEYYGSVFSALVMFATKQLRTDAAGIVTIVQA